MSQNPTISASHFSICVSNIERSVHFYTEALGFVLDYYVDVGSPFEVLTELPKLKARAGFFRLDGARIELLHYESPAATGSNERRPMNQLGFTHMGLVVDSIDAVADRIVRYGGHVYSETKVKHSKGELVFCTDPDGVRIELWQKAV
jgi:predicted enzyme related to lactoylglutathione lyase